MTMTVMTASTTTNRAKDPRTSVATAAMTMTAIVTSPLLSVMMRNPRTSLHLLTTTTDRKTTTVVRQGVRMTAPPISPTPPHPRILRHPPSVVCSIKDRDLTPMVVAMVRPMTMTKRL